MAGRKRHTPEKIIRKLRYGVKLPAAGAEVEGIARQLDVSVPRFRVIQCAESYRLFFDLIRNYFFCRRGL